MSLFSKSSEWKSLSFSLTVFSRFSRQPNRNAISKSRKFYSEFVNLNWNAGAQLWANPRGDEREAKSNQIQNRKSNHENAEKSSKNLLSFREFLRERERECVTEWEAERPPMERIYTLFRSGNGRVQTWSEFRAFDSMMMIGRRLWWSTFCVVLGDSYRYSMIYLFIYLELKWKREVPPLWLCRPIPVLFTNCRFPFPLYKIN